MFVLRQHNRGERMNFTSAACSSGAVNKSFIMPSARGEMTIRDVFHFSYRHKVLRNEKLCGRMTGAEINIKHRNSASALKCQISFRTLFSLLAAASSRKALWEMMMKPALMNGFQRRSFAGEKLKLRVRRGWVRSKQLFRRIGSSYLLILLVVFPRPLICLSLINFNFCAE